MTLADQARRLLDLGIDTFVPDGRALLSEQLAGLPDVPGSTLAVHPSLIPARDLAALLERGGKPGFVVVDMDDLEQFGPVQEVSVPDRPFYVLHDVERGDELRNWSPDEALPEILGRARSPLTVSEGISWLLQEPARLEPNHCFMTIGSRRRLRGRLDARTPAIWISGGTGRDGRERRGAPKVGWCWAGNRHTWLGFASAGGRSG